MELLNAAASMHISTAARMQMAMQAFIELSRRATDRAEKDRLLMIASRYAHHADKLGA